MRRALLYAGIADCVGFCRNLSGDLTLEAKYAILYRYNRILETDCQNGDGL